jgi:cytochrome c oxidase cbb3-type subunit 2
LPIAATDLTLPNRFKNGMRPQDIYRTLVTGFSGTPMPSYADSLARAGGIRHYVLARRTGSEWHENGR